MIPDLRDLVARAMEREGVPGAAYGVLEDGKITTRALGGDALVVRTSLKQLVPVSLTTFPDPAPSRLRAYAPDRLVGVEGPLKDARVEAIRGDDGRVGWLRLGGRIRRKVPTPGASAAAPTQSPSKRP